MPARCVFLFVALFGLLAFANCESTAAGRTRAVNAGAVGVADAPQFAAGRELFTRRCSNCHVLPNLAKHSAEQWPGLITKMAKRSGLKLEQQQSVLTYILAARKQRQG